MSAFYGVPLTRSTPLRLPMHRDAPQTAGWHAWAASEERPLAVDLFAGAGGLSHGLEAAGYTVALAVDVDSWAIETHRHNFRGTALNVDLAQPERRDEVVSLLSGLDIALVAGGPPCQPYSRAGRSKIRSLVRDGVRSRVDHRRELWRAFLDVALRVRPQSILMENVPDMAIGDDMAVLRVILDELALAGYDVEAGLVDTANHGVPQHRQRLIIVATRDPGIRFEWPAAVGHVTLREAIDDLPAIDAAAGETGGAEMPYDGPNSDFQRRARKNCLDGAAGLVFDHVTRAVRDDDLKAFAHMDASTRYSDLPEELRRYRDDIFDDKYKRLGWEELSRSITAHIAKDGYWYIHPRDLRTLSVRESARIQTFPDDFRFAGSRSHQYRQIGNAVPPALAEAIGGALLESMRSPGGLQASRMGGVRTIRAALDSWAAADQKTAATAYPSSPWTVAVRLLAENRADAWPNAAYLLDLMPSVAAATPERLQLAQRLAVTPRSRLRMARLARLAEGVRRDPRHWEGDLWRSAVLPAERMWLDVLAVDSTKMAATSATLRVVARLTGTSVDRERRRSDGRMELAKIVGAGEYAPVRNVALHRIGTDVCTTTEPACQDCPLVGVCPSVSQAG